MKERLSETGTSRRALLTALGALGLRELLGSALGRPRPASAEGKLADLGPEETVDATMKRLFPGRAIKDGGDSIKIDLPLIAENGAVVPIAVDINAPMTPLHYVKAIYVISDRNRRPLNVTFNLTPAMGRAYVGTNLRLGETTDVRAVVEMSDGGLLQARREVKVTVGGCGG